MSVAGSMITVTDRPDLTEWLAARPAGELAAVLGSRDDVLWGAPLRGLSDLADRLAGPASVARAITALPLPGFQLIHAVAALGPRPTVSAVARLLSAGNAPAAEHRAAVLSILDLLAEHALAWLVDDDVVGINGGVWTVVDEPLGIGRTVAGHLEHTSADQLESIARTLGLPAGMRRADTSAVLESFLTDADNIAALLAGAPEAVARRLLLLSTDRHSRTHHRARDQQEREGDNWARRRGLLFGGQYYEPDVPVEVVLAVLGADLTVRFDPLPPPVQTVLASAESVRAGASAAAGSFTETVAGLLDSMTRTPIPGLRAGGIGVREVARLAKSLESEESVVRMALELIRDLGLLGGREFTFGAGETAAAWRAGDPSTRFADLAVAWWGLPITPTVARNPEGKVMPALAGRIVDGSAMELRWSVIDAVAALPTGSAVAGEQTLIRRMNWQSPGLFDADDPAIAAIWAEAHLLGVLAQGALTPVGRALVDRDPSALLSVAAAMLAPAATVGSFGSDLTVMVAGSPSAAVSTLLDSCADRESRGAAVVWRFSPASVRRAFDEGVTADSLISALRDIAEADLPQPLTYLIADVQRRHGTLVVMPALSGVRSEDEPLLIEVAAHRSLRSLQPHLLAPTVLLFQGSASAVVQALRAAGYMPVPADEHGVVTLGRSSAADDGGGDSGTARRWTGTDMPAEAMVNRLPDLCSAASPDRLGGRSGVARVRRGPVDDNKACLVAGGRAGRGSVRDPADDRDLRRRPGTGRAASADLRHRAPAPGPDHLPVRQWWDHRPHHLRHRARRASTPRLVPPA